jgi:two-component system chemotaxis response regulator CheB
MLELQKIIPALEPDETAAVLVLQNMYPGMAKHLAAYFNSFTAYVVSTLTLGEELLGGQCRIGNCHGRQQFSLRQGAPMLSGEEDEFHHKPLDTDNLLHSAAEVFKAGLTLILLSGVDVDLKLGMEAVKKKGGRIILQDPESSLLPGPLECLKTLALEECCLRPEDIASYLAAKRQS